MKPVTPRKQGFTLLEVLVALGIVAIISILSWRGLNEVLRSTARVNDVDNASQVTMATLAQLESDLASLSLGLASRPDEEDSVSVNSTGLLILTTQRNTGESGYREEIQWTLTGQGLIRTARREGEDSPPVVSDPIPMVGMQIRLLREGGAWSNAMAIGNYSPLNNTDITLQGNALANKQNLPKTPPATPPEAPPDGTGEPPKEAPMPTAGPGDGLEDSEDAAQVKAVEIGLTQANKQTVMRLILTGGVY